MNVSEAIRGRRSVRRYEARPVERAALVRLVEAACWAPSAGNMQTWSFGIVTEPERLRKLRMVAPGMIGDPPAAIVVCENVAEAERRAGEVGAGMSTMMDPALAAYAICLQAYEDGLGTCLIGSFHAGAVGKLLQLPEGVEAKLVVSVGYGATEPKAPPKRTDDVYFFERYGGGRE